MEEIPNIHTGMYPKPCLSIIGLTTNLKWLSRRISAINSTMQP